MVTLDTPRLRLRPLGASDAQPLMEIHEDPEILRHIIIGTAVSGITGAWRAIASIVGHWQLRGYGQWAVVEKATGQVIGRVGPWHPEGWPGLELGWIIRRSRWGNGFATEAAQAALEWIWRSVDSADHVISLIQPHNFRSIRVAEKIGERLEGTHVLNGTVVNVYGIHKPRP